MANTFELIASSTVGAGGAASIDFTSIPSTYTDLVVKLSTKISVVSSSTTFYYLNMQINSSTGTYTSRRIYGVGSISTPYSNSGNTTNYSSIAFSNDSRTPAANTFNNTEIYIPNYAGSNAKSFSTDGVTEGNESSAVASFVAGLWSGTAAITSLSFTPESGGGNFVQYSTAYLYGVKNA